MVKPYIVYTDGAYSRRYGKGAFSYVMLDGEGVEVRRGCWLIRNETNNRAELKAIITALYHLPESVTDVTVYSDSQYALNTLSGKWEHNNNEDLFDAFQQKVLSQRNLDISWEWVKGHSGNKYNELCDQMCVEALGFDPGEEYKSYKKAL